MRMQTIKRKNKLHRTKPSLPDFELDSELDSELDAMEAEDPELVLKS